jgi:hypothetical protein
MAYSNPLAGFRWKRLLLIILITLGLILSGVLYFYYGLVYSDGYRAGTLIKFSRKGYVFKTYEGEINQGGITQTIPGGAMVNQIWAFSVKDKETARQLEKMEGKVVRLHYKQYQKMFPWEGDTNYLVDGVEVVR